MSLVKTGRIDSWGPKIFLGSAAGELSSVCLTAPDKAEDFEGQTRAILAVIDNLNAQMGASRDDLIMAQVWLADISDWREFSEIWNEWTAGIEAPGLSVVQMAASRRDSLIEIRTWSQRKD